MRQCACCLTDQPETGCWLCIDTARVARWVCTVCLDALWAKRGAAIIAQRKSNKTSKRGGKNVKDQDV